MKIKAKTDPITSKQPQNFEKPLYLDSAVYAFEYAIYPLAKSAYPFIQPPIR